MAREVVSVDDRDFLRLMEELPAALVSQRGGPVLVGLRRGGNSMRKSWREEVQRITEEPNISGDYRSTGTYAKSIKVTRMRRPQRVGGNEAVRVTVPGSAEYPDGTRVAMVAGVLESGREDMEAKAPMRKAFDRSKEEVLASTLRGIDAGIQRAIKKLDKTAKS